MTLKEKIQSRMSKVGFDQWFRIAFQMAGQQDTSMVVMMFVIDELAKVRADKVQITHPMWKSWTGFGRSRIKTAGKVLGEVGVIYTNHTLMEWHIEEALFWRAFEEAFALVFPFEGGTGGDGEHARIVQGNESEPVDSVQGSESSEGSATQTDARNEHLIDKIDELNNETGVSAEIFARHRLKFGLPEGHLLERMIAAARRLGVAATNSIIQRCIDNFARTWKYIARALDKEVFDLTQPRQLKLMPFDAPTKRASQAKPSFDVKAAFDDGANPPVDAPALPEPITEIVRRPAATTGKHAEIWQAAYDQMRLQDSHKFDQYLRDARLVDGERDVFVIETVSEPVRQMLQNRLYRWVAGIVSTTLGATAKLEFVTAQRMAVAS